MSDNSIDEFFKSFLDNKDPFIKGFGHLSSKKEEDFFKEMILLASIMFDMPINKEESIKDIILILCIFRRLLEQKHNFLKAILLSKVIYDNIGDEDISLDNVKNISDKQEIEINKILNNADVLRKLELTVCENYGGMIIMIRDMIDKGFLQKDYTDSALMLYIIGTGLKPFSVFKNWETVCPSIRNTFDNVYLSIKYLLLWRLYNFLQYEQLKSVPISSLLSEEQMIVFQFYIEEFKDWCINPTFSEILYGIPVGMLNAHPSSRNPLLSKNFKEIILDNNGNLSIVPDQPYEEQDPSHNLNCLVIFCLIFIKSLIEIKFKFVPEIIKLDCITPERDCLIPEIISNIFLALINSRGVAGTQNRVYLYINSNNETFLLTFEEDCFKVRLNKQ